MDPMTTLPHVKDSGYIRMLCVMEDNGSHSRFFKKGYDDIGTS